MHAVQKVLPSKRPCLIFFPEEQLGNAYDEDRGRNELALPLKRLCDSRLVPHVIVAVMARKDGTGAGTPSEEFDGREGGLSPASVLPGLVPEWMLKYLDGAHGKALVAALADRKPATHLRTPASRFILEEMRPKKTLGEVSANPDFTHVECITLDAGVMGGRRAVGYVENFAKQQGADAVLVYLEGNPFPEVGEVMRHLNTLHEGESRFIDWFPPSAA